MSSLQLGIEEYRKGQKESARKYFIAAMKEEPKNENVWGWLYQVAISDGERLTALRKVVEINPQNEKARQLLNQLQSKSAPVAKPAPPKSAPPAPQKNNSTRNLLFAAVGVGVLFCCLLAMFNANSITSKPVVKYVISGTGSALITYFNETGGTEQVTQSLPFMKEMTVAPGAALSLVAQNNGTGAITCEIWVNGEKRKSSTSTAQYGVVTCSDFVY